jgi:hypothetical protein
MPEGLDDNQLEALLYPPPPAVATEQQRGHRGTGRDHPALTSAPRAGVPLLHRHPRPDETLRRRAVGCRLRAGTGLGHAPYSSVATILKNAQDRKAADPEQPSLFHENIRGSCYYH